MRVFAGYTMIVATIFSTIFHFFVLTLVDTFALAPNKIAPRSVSLMVDFLPVEETIVSPQEEKQEREKTGPTMEVKKETPRKEETKVKKDVEMSTSKRIPREETKPKVDDEQRRKAAIQDIEKRVAEREAAVTASVIERYNGMIQERVRGFWTIPDTLSGGKLEAVIIIEIDSEGRVVGRRIEKSSGDPSYDQSAMRAISKAAPFPAPPGKMSVEIGLVFHPD